MIAEGTKDFSPVYSSWFGKPVVVLVIIRQCHFPMPCHIVDESAADVRVLIHPGWEMDVRKDLILAVEEFVATEARCVSKPVPRPSIVRPDSPLPAPRFGTGVPEAIGKRLLNFRPAPNLSFTY